MTNDIVAGQLEQAVPPFDSYPPSRLQHLAIGLGKRLPDNYAGRRAAGWIRSLAQATAKTPIDVEVFGVRMRLRLNDNSCERRLMVTPQYFEPVSLRELKRRIKSGCHFVDVGANVGLYSLLAASGGGRNARILAIEPNPGLTKRLHENALLNGFNILIEEVAASDADGVVTLRLDENNLGASSLLPDVNQGRQARPLDVPSARLIDVVRKHGFERIDAMKLDIEGGEDTVLEAFIKEAPEELWPKFLIVEHNNDIWQWDVEAEFVKRGWKKIPSHENLLLERA